MAEPIVIDTAHIVCHGVGVTIRCPSVRLSVCLSHPAPQPWHAMGLLLWAQWAGDIDWQRRAPSSTAFSSKCEQCHVYSRHRRLNTYLYFVFNLYWHSVILIIVMLFDVSRIWCLRPSMMKQVLWNSCSSWNGKTKNCTRLLLVKYWNHRLSIWRYFDIFLLPALWCHLSYLCILSNL